MTVQWNERVLCIVESVLCSSKSMVRLHKYVVRVNTKPSAGVGNVSLHSHITLGEILDKWSIFDA
jgi:hypothetical protein